MSLDEPDATNRDGSSVIGVYLGKFQSAEEVAVRKQAHLPGSRHVVLAHVQHAKVMIAWLTRRLARI